jgi:hypothetical protein
MAASALQAERIVNELRNAGFASEDVSVLLPDKTMTRDFAHEKHTKAPEGATTGVGGGAMLGGGRGGRYPRRGQPWQAQIREGNILISVHTETADERRRVIDILAANQARDISTAGEATTKAPLTLAAEAHRKTWSLIAMPVGPDVEDAEFAVPCERLRDAGHEVVVFGPRAGEEIHGKRGKIAVTTDRAATQLDPPTVTALDIPTCACRWCAGR